MKSKLPFVILLLSFIAACKKDSETPSGPLPEVLNRSAGKTKYIVLASARRENGSLIGTLSVYNPDMTVKWSKEHWVRGSDHMAYGKGVLYISPVSGPVKALDIETGNELWRYGGETSFYSGLCLKGDTLYFVSGSTNRLHVLDVNTHSAIYTLTSDYIAWTPAVAGNTVLIQGLPQQTFGPYYLKAIDNTTRSEKWSMPLSSWPSSLRSSSGLFYAYYSSPFGDDGLWAVDTSGVVKWTKKGENVVAPIYDDGVIYSSFNDGLWALDTITGSTKWHYKPTYDWYGNSTAVNNGKLYAQRPSSSDLVFDTRIGQVVKEVVRGTPHPYSYYLPNLVVSNDMLIRLRSGTEIAYTSNNLVEIVNPNTGIVKDSIKIVCEEIGPVGILTQKDKWLKSNY